MITGRDAVEVHAWRQRGWSIPAIDRHLDRDRKTVRAYVNGNRVPGLRTTAAPDPLEPFAAYVAQRLADDPHVWATVLFDEVVELGSTGRIRASPGCCGPGRCARTARPALA